MTTRKPIGVAIIGFGYWGPQLFKSLSMVPDADMFGQEFAAYCGVKHAVGVASGQSANGAPVKCYRCHYTRNSQ